ncbi:DUF5134 domain-containing protein [Actinosynnema sp. NPDC047251]|uniref:Uncharacterized protein n=1 Tax=Saccharothrix espanaensis (strain ATCC 51144 / DSM 44229 / JCM 9112 / NBRC 15066 / NRRL 15764) TaxID=1179773 RepID=K0K6X1_SACES|nr:DUF5134 domain-containing protein [Saccharothrix espanaensis]CCH33282.1 hypothetical protein BN6_60260 [Saccharothrix espanaensis DSM 44229]
MIENLAACWALTAAFGTVGLAHLRGLVPGTPVVQRVGEVAHVAMCGAMIAMLWPWGGWLPSWPQVVLFACAGAWFTAHGLVIVVSGEPALRVAAVPASHALGMFAMVWMLVAAGTGAHHPGGPGSAGPAWPVSFPASVLGLGSLVVAGWWLVKALRRDPAGRVAPDLSLAGHAVLNGGMAVMLLAMR